MNVKLFSFNQKNILKYLKYLLFTNVKYFKMGGVIYDSRWCKISRTNYTREATKQRSNGAAKASSKGSYNGCYKHTKPNASNACFNAAN